MPETDEPTTQAAPTDIGQSYSGRVFAEGTKIQDKDYRCTVVGPLGAKGVVFRDCDFSYCIMTHGYFRQAQFYKCNFTGCQFCECNFRDCKFEDCNFSYAMFNRTFVAAEDLFNQTPKYPNVRAEIARNLRVNAESMGDAESARKCFEFEMEQHEIYLSEGWSARESYYKKRYPGPMKRMDFALRLIAHRLSASVWGHGESPRRILGFTLIASIILSVLWTLLSNKVYGVEFFPAVRQALWYAPAIMLGYVPPGVPDGVWAKLLVIANSILGYVAFGLLIVAFVKRYTKR